MGTSGTDRPCIHREGPKGLSSCHTVHPLHSQFAFEFGRAGCSPSLSITVLACRRRDVGYGGAGGERGAMKREKCMYGFQFRIFMRSGHSGGARGGPQRGEGRRPERILCYASIEKWADQDRREGVGGRGEGKEGWKGPGRQYTCRICIFNIFCLGESTSSAASQPLSVLGVEWYCQASRLRRKVALLFRNSQSLSGNLHTPFLETWKVLSLLPSSLSSLAMHDHRPSWIYFRKSFLPCWPAPPPPPP